MNNDQHVAVVVYGSVGDWHEADVIYPGGEGNFSDESTVHGRILVVPMSEVMGVVDDYGVEDVNIVREADNE